MKLWGGRFKKGTNDLVNDFNSSIRVDSRMYKEDVEGSLAHVKMLGKQKIIPSKASKKIEDGLNEMLKRMDNGVIGIDPSSEDIHSFVEGTLTYYIDVYSLKDKNLFDLKVMLNQMDLEDEDREVMNLLQGIYFLKCDKVEEAIELFTDAIDLDPYKSKECYLKRAEAYKRIGELEKAYDDYKKALVFDRENLNVVRELADCCYALDYFEEAIDLYNIIAKDTEGDWEISAIISSLNGFLIEEYENKETRTEKENFYLVDCYLKANEYEKCSEILKTLEDNENVEKEKLYFLQGKLLRNLGRNEEALEYFDKTLEIDPENKEIYEYKANILNDLNRDEEALECYKKLIGENEENDYVYDKMAEILYKAGKYEKSLED